MGYKMIWHIKQLLKASMYIYKEIKLSQKEKRKTNKTNKKQNIISIFLSVSDSDIKICLDIYMSDVFFLLYYFQEHMFKLPTSYILSP
jgi:hypothetical protein